MHYFVEKAHNRNLMRLAGVLNFGMLVLGLWDYSPALTFKLVDFLIVLLYEGLLASGFTGVFIFFRT